MNPTILEVIARQAEDSPDAVAIEAQGRSPLTYRRLCDHLRGAVARLNALGVGKGDRVAIVLPNSPETATACLAVMSCATAVVAQRYNARAINSMLWKRTGRLFMFVPLYCIG